MWAIMKSTCYISRHSARNILDDFREAYYWLRQNTDENARVMSWWDYGYQIAGMANRTTLVDNNTWNNSHIALVRACVCVCVRACVCVVKLGECGPTGHTGGYR